MKKVNKFQIGRYLIGCVAFILGIIAIFTIYGIGYNMLKDTEYANFFGYYAHELKENNMDPDYKPNDLVILKGDYSYNTDDIVLFKYKSSYRLGVVKDLSMDRYVIQDNKETIDSDYDITSEMIVGKVVFKIAGFASIFGILTSPVTVICIVIFIFGYFFLTTGDRDKWQ